MTYYEEFRIAYIEAAEFTDPETTPTALFLAQAHQATRQFLQALNILQPSLVRPLNELPISQMGHDLWLTRNGHGTGFWDRNELYSNTEARIFDALATAMGEHDIYS